MMKRVLIGLKFLLLGVTVLVAGRSRGGNRLGKLKGPVTDVTKCHDNIACDLSLMEFYTYPDVSSSENAFKILEQNVSTLAMLYKDKNPKDVIVIMGGFLSAVTGKDSTVLTIVKGFHEHARTKGVTHVILAIDWKHSNGNAACTIPNYCSAASKIENFGSHQRIPDFLELVLQQFGWKFDKMVLVGHSSAAHLAGAIGKAIIDKKHDLLARIDALDPAGPGFFSDRHPLSRKLTATDARTVVVYNTNCGRLGLGQSIGTSNIYFNNCDFVQPGCEFTLDEFANYQFWPNITLDFITGLCAHSKVVDFDVDHVKSCVPGEEQLHLVTAFKLESLGSSRGRVAGKISLGHCVAVLPEGETRIYDVPYGNKRARLDLSYLAKQSNRVIHSIHNHSAKGTILGVAVTVLKLLLMLFWLPQRLSEASIF